MKINPSLGFDHYKNTVQSVKNGEGAGKVQLESRLLAGEAVNTDKVMISGDAAARAEMSRMATAIGAEVDGAGNAARLAELRASVEQGSYYVGTAALANAILGVEE